MAAGNALRFNPDTGYWEGTVELPGGPVSMRIDGGYLEIEVAPIVEGTVETLQEAWSDIEADLVKSLLGTYNESWRDDDEPQLETEAFLARITLDGVVVMEARSMTLYFRDDDLFYGHAIEIHVKSDGELGEAVLVG